MTFYYAEIYFVEKEIQCHRNEPIGAGLDSTITSSVMLWWEPDFGARQSIQPKIKFGFYCEDSRNLCNMSLFLFP